jgi:hypothetical protein
MQLLYYGEYLPHKKGCETHRWLIKEKKRWAGHEGTPDRQHLLLSARERAPKLFLSLREPGEDGKDGLEPRGQLATPNLRTSYSGKG